MWSSAMMMEVSESMMMLFMPLVRALTMVVNAVFDLVYEGLIVNADVGVELDHGLDQVIQAVIDHVNGGFSVIDEVGLAPDHGLDQGVHVHTYLIFVIFFTQAKFLENKIYTKKRQLFALNL